MHSRRTDGRTPTQGACGRLSLCRRSAFRTRPNFFPDIDDKPMQLKKIAILTLAAFGLAATCTQPLAKTADEVRARCRAEHRPCVGLVLSGGGARGFAHTGVLDVIEELGIKIDVVTGTSMGSMVGGAYAAGYSAAEIRDIVLGVDWDRMMAPRADREELPWRLKVDDYKNLAVSGIEFGKDGRVKLPDSVIPSEELDLFLNDKTGPANYVNDLTELAIPFGAIATDLVSGERVVLQKDVSLGMAMRASMSLPGVFAPVVIHDRMLVDGGLLDNLPVSLAREMGADVIIAVNVGTPLLKREELGNVVTVMAQMVNLLTEQNVRQSLADLGPEDILITPDLDDFSSADLKKSDKIITRGYDAAQKVRDRLERLASPDRAQWIAWDETRKGAVMPHTRRDIHEISTVKVEGLKVANPEAILNELDIDTSRPVSNAEIDAASRRVWADGAYSSVRYRFEPGSEGTEVLVFEPKEKKPGYSSIRIGGSLETDFRDEHTFTVLLAHTWGWLNPWGAELRSEIQAGKNRRAGVEFYQPLGPGSDWFVNPSFEYSVSPFNVYENGEAIARYKNETSTAQIGLGYSIERLGYARVAAGYFSQASTRTIGVTDLSTPEVESPFVSAELLLDTLDSVNFPTKGYRFALQGQRIFDTDGPGYKNIYEANVYVPITYGRWTTLFSGKLGRSAVPSVFSLGGAFELTGSPYGRWTGSDIQLGSVRISRNISDWLGAGERTVWLGASAEAGRAYNRDEEGESGNRDWHRAVGGYVGVDSIIGPLYLMAGRTMDEGWGVYFFWGRKM